MTKLREVYRCPICGNIVEVLNPGAGTLVCCGQPMVLLEGNVTDAAHEKHVPVVEKIDGVSRHLHRPEDYLQKPPLYRGHSDRDL